MNILAIDTSSDILSLALAEQKDESNFSILDELNEPSKARHGETLLTHIEHLLRKNNLKIQNIGLIVVGIGPGLFTGTRIGAATAQALAFSLNIPCVGVPSIWAVRDALREQKAKSEFLIPVIRAYRGEVYSATYQQKERTWNELHPVAYLAPEKLTERIKSLPPGLTFVLGGNGMDELREEKEKNTLSQFLQNAQILTPTAKHLVEHGVKIFLEGRIEEHPPLPMYVRPTDAELDLKKKSNQMD